ncbi:unnamed protein product [Prorocentrum cordatum]|uniref:Sugar phosphate transporter domain-containing protein n=1 Tax=Prorocentrum cordatum TaxID=2364126 RepID=A0ABN9PTZ5_9DINO|nr:unnamed protein product [Polarella glacialis]
MGGSHELPSKGGCLRGRWSARAAVKGAGGAGATGALLTVALYAANVGFNVLNKQTLTAVPDFPVWNTVLHFGVGSCLSLAAWALRLQRPPASLSAGALECISPLVFLHCVAILFTNLAVAKVNLSLVHTIKAAEPFYAACLSFLVLGIVPSAGALGCLALIVSGVMMASISEVSFTYVGFLAAMGSNLGFCLKNVLSKKLQADARVDELNLISLLTLGSLFVGLPFAIWREGMNPPFGDAVVLVRGVSAGVLFHLYQIASVLMLYRASPVTHSVINIVKRPVLIVVSIAWFGTPVGWSNGLGLGCALLGCYAYSFSKR